MGPTISKNAEPVGLKRGVLYVWVRNSTWMQQMTFMKEHILETINRKFETRFVKSIQFTLDRHAVPNQDNHEFKNLIQKIAPENEDNE